MAKSSHPQNGTETMAMSLAFILIIYCYGGETVAALLEGKQHNHGGGGHCYPGLLRRDPLFHQHQPPTLRSIIMPALFSATTSSAISDSDARSMKMRELALQLKEENNMPPMSVDSDEVNDGRPDFLNEITGSHHSPHCQYDEDCRTPIESEFMGLISQFLSYTEQDIQSLTTTSNLYPHYDEEANNSKTSRNPRRRSREEGIRYRTIYSGVQAAALDHEVLRAFTILFEDYIPIRLAGRRIYRHLQNVMEEVRAERKGEMERVRDLCPDWDCIVKEDFGEETNVLEYGRSVWDTLMDEALLLEHSLDSSLDDKDGTVQDGGVLSVHQLLDLGIDQVLIQEGVVNSVAQLETIVRNMALREENDMKHHHEHHYSAKKRDRHKGEKYLAMTFPIYMNVMYQCASSPSSSPSSSSSKQLKDGSYILDVLRKIEQKVLDHRITVIGVDNHYDVSSLLASKAVYSGSSIRCAQREKYSNRFDLYVSTFQLWERKFLSVGDNAVDSEKQQQQQQQQQQARRFEILRGCFVGARNRRNVAALKIVYLDYNALRIAGDLIFQLMSKLTNKIV